MIFLVFILLSNTLSGINALSFTPPSSKLFEGRRAFLSENILIVTTLTTPFEVRAEVRAEEENETNRDGVDSEGQADRGNKPFAPPAALLPVMRLKLWFEDSNALACKLSTTTDQNERNKIVQEMNSSLSNPPRLFYSEKMEKITSGSTAQLNTGISDVNKDQYQINRKGMNAGDKMAAMLNQADVERQWGMLRYAESKREESNEMRAAFNFYTRQLSYGDKYLLTAPKEERKKMIRNDELPSLTAVITSDLDRRDLFRNQFLTAVEDACAEVKYQAKQNTEDIDVSDIIDLMNEASVALENWFILVPQRDVKETKTALQLPMAK